MSVRRVGGGAAGIVRPAGISICTQRKCVLALTQEGADALKVLDQIGHEVENPNMLPDEPEKHSEEVLGLGATELAGSVAQHKELAAGDDASQLGVARMEETSSRKRGVRVQEPREGASHDRRGARTKCRMRQAGSAEQKSDPDC